MPRKQRFQRQDETVQNEGGNTKSSRSAHKRRSLALQNVGARLTRLDPEALRKLNLPPKLYEAVCRYADTRGHEARRRQIQYIGRLMRAVDEPTLHRLPGHVSESKIF
ncbi:ribosome biogenesis factor YjgA [Candidatus Desulfovibrio trichonymphae]|uniref:ribosome biogenesis factor YjgA n=1 Tax=Candidatus Desulfovibrio trichonymphae TaxID=1725232 RepID=UPI000BBABEEF|nr:ribosome biogenesis factor YjgA [Candidatus Desulfovibrio trichonymphae]GHU91087.1 hypothetical protein AGMMS49925_05060 [Deltaproteobacteria bacterium]GHU98396.1 hypothetical protein AGMMS50248_04910 [Deltaproteobacteria bacterium]